MPIVVADASAIAAIVFVEAEADAVVEMLGSADLAAPTLLSYEIANVATVKLRRRLITRAAAATALALFGRLDVRLHAVDAAAAFEVANETSLTAYDAAYVALARALHADLVTLDVKVERAFRGFRPGTGA
jgi:predicted nucleic acid-binding protein